MISNEVLWNNNLAALKLLRRISEWIGHRLRKPEGRVEKETIHWNRRELGVEENWKIQEGALKLRSLETE